MTLNALERFDTPGLGLSFVVAAPEAFHRRHAPLLGAQVAIDGGSWRVTRVETFLGYPTIRQGERIALTVEPV